MSFYCDSPSVLTMNKVCIFCMCVLLSFGLSGCNDIKYTGKALLRGHIDPKKLDTGLPVIKIDTHKHQKIVGKEHYINAGIEIIDPDNSSNNLKTSLEIRGRGNSTWEANKKPYRLKFFEKTALFGYEKAKSWVLLANNQDPTLILNTTAYELGRRMGFPFVNHCTHVELILNGRYEGSYVVTEQVQVNPGRVDIDENAGFLVELDGYYDDEPKFRTAILELPVMIKSPEDLTGDSAYDFVKTAINELEAAVISDSFPNTNYRELIDLDNFIDFMIINEITKNEDFQIPHSVYLYRDSKKGSRIMMGPLWDFDLGFDADRGVYFNDTAGMFYNTTFREGPGQVFFARFFEDAYFREKYKERWNKHYHLIAGMETFMDQMAVLLDKSIQADRKVWWWKKGDPKKEIERMKDWWRSRIKYLDTEINKF